MRSSAAKPFDDRVGCSILIDLLQNGPYPVTVLAAFTVQEEIGLRGAQVAAQRIQPNAAIVLEGTPAHDVPNPNREVDAGDLPPNPGTRMGAGAVLTLVDGRMIADPRVTAFLRAMAEDRRNLVSTQNCGWWWHRWRRHSHGAYGRPNDDAISALPLHSFADGAAASRGLRRRTASFTGCLAGHHAGDLPARLKPTR